MTKNKIITVKGTQITVIEQNDDDYISLTDMVKAKDGDTILTLKKITPVRMMKTPFTLKAQQEETAGKSKEELTKLLGKSRERKGIFEGNWKEGEFEMGQSSGLVKEVLPAAEVVRRTMKEFEEARSRIMKR